MTNFEMDLFDTRMNSYTIEKEESEHCCQHSVIRPACIPISVISLFIILIVFFPLINEDDTYNFSRFERDSCDSCSLQIVESIPTNLTYPRGTHNPPTYEVWRELLDSAKKTIDIAALYWDLRDNSRYPTSWQGDDIFHRIISTADRGVKIRIAQNAPSSQFPQLDTKYFSARGHALVRSLNFTNLLGSGVLHTKFWIVDLRHIYIGSANMDWKSLTEVKELGYVIRNCPCMAMDLFKIFAVYWRLGEEEAKIPSKWPLKLRTYFNFSNPLNLNVNNKSSKVFISSSPAEFNTNGREHDADAIVKAIGSAREFIYVAVMDYLPATIYMPNNMFWPKIDDAIRDAAFRGVNVRLLMSHWNHSKPEMIPYLESLLDINAAVPLRQNSSGKIEVKLFTVPTAPSQWNLTYARVNHNKYMLTEQIAYVGTSNWVGDYFITTAGVGVSFFSESIINSLKNVFLRDWFSAYAQPM